MNKNLERFFLLYATASRQELQLALSSESRPSIEAALIDLLTLYFNDRNSSALREWVTLVVAGYQPAEGKLGYNGYRLVGPQPQVKQFCEVKPVNTHRDEEGKVKRRLSGQGNFSDYTPERFWRDLEAEVQMVISGFAEGKLLYVIEFPIRCLQARLIEVLRREFKEWDPGSPPDDWRRPKNKYLRSASFNFKHYESCDKKRLLYCAPDLSQWKEFMTRAFYAFLTQECERAREEDK